MFIEMSVITSLWQTMSLNSKPRFQPHFIQNWPETVQRYLQHAIAPETPLASTVRLHMSGEIKLKRWLPFTAEQVIHWHQGMIWQATTRMYGMPIRGFDRLLKGQGEMHWQLLGLIPVIKARGEDISRSIIGRMQAESIWLPGCLCYDSITWHAPSPTQAHAEFTLFGEPTRLELTLQENGQLASIKLKRWGNPQGGDFCYLDFGALVEDETTFEGYTIPSRLRVGWYLGSERFESEGEFFRVTVKQASYR